MKSLFYLLFVSCLILSTGCNTSDPEIVIPQKLQDALAAKYPGSENIRWNNKDSVKYEVSFRLQKKMYLSQFSLDGKWMLTEKKIIISELPATVNRTLEDGFGNYRIRSIKDVESAENGNYFIVKILSGKEEKHLFLSREGVILTFPAPPK